LQKRVCELEDENSKLKERINKYEPSEKDEPAKLAPIIENGNAKSTEKAAILSDVPVPALQPPPNPRNRNNSSNQQPGPVNLLDVDLESHDNTLTIANQNLINDILDQDFNPRAQDVKAERANESERADNKKASMGISQEKDIFGCEPFQVQQDPFGMGQFNSSDLDSAIVSLDKKIAEMRDGFSRGLSAGGFNLD